MPGVSDAPSVSVRPCQWRKNSQRFARNKIPNVLTVFGGLSQTYHDTNDFYMCCTNHAVSSAVCVFGNRFPFFEGEAELQKEPNIHRQKNGGLLWSFRLEGEAEYEIITKKSYV